MEGEFQMRTTLVAALAAAALAAPTAALAGNPLPPPVEPEIIVADTGSSAQGIVVPVLALIFAAAALAN